MYINRSNKAGMNRIPHQIHCSRITWGPLHSLAIRLLGSGLLALLLVLQSLPNPAHAEAPGIPTAWGYNYSGQLGNYSTTNRLSAVRWPYAGGFIAIAGGSGHSLALMGYGSVIASGHNGYGQLGDGTTTGRLGPTYVSGISCCMKAIAAGSFHSLALRSDGTVWAWGYNAYGQLGTTTTTTCNGFSCSSTPVRVSSLSKVIAIAGGSNHSLALRSDGTVWAWGYNASGQLGDGTTTNRLFPVNVSGLSHVIAIAAGSGHSLALRSDGTVRAWGHNAYGQLGDGTTTNRFNPVSVNLGGFPVKAIAAGSFHTLALSSYGQIRVWGHNAYGQLGDGTTTNRLTAVKALLDGAGQITAIAAGSSHSLALNEYGVVRAWGYNAYGQLGDGTTTNRLNPMLVSTPNGGVLRSVIAIAAGSLHSLALISPP